jgi:hypothetical protein
MLAHLAYRPTLGFSTAWGQLMRYAIGGLVLIPMRLMFWRRLSAVEKPLDRLVLSDVLSLFGVGAGVLAGHLTDKMHGK